ncbi:base excision DNA repair protein [Colletotrichum truncatum]|uniref:Base excision DNA repair protein n=1 Tax=Colletotrichum truncatum TaxID=5467 RepID=A0ACC3YDD4_COLTU
MQTRAASAAMAGPKKERKRKTEDSGIPKSKKTAQRRGRPKKTPSSPSVDAEEKISFASPNSTQVKESTPAADIQVDAASPRELEGSPPTKNLADKKWTAWSKHAKSSPYPDFLRPTPEECQTAHDILEKLHGDVVRETFADPDAPSQEYPYVMDALVVAALSQATSWSNAKRAMKNMKVVYGSTFNYDAIEEGGMDKLIDALRPGGMQNRKAKILMQLLKDVKKRHGKWDLQFLFDVSDEEAVKEVMSYWGLGPKCAFCLLSICLKRDTFAVDAHIYRISGLWGWRPREASREMAQAHLDARIPNQIKFALHYQLIVHGQKCPVCRGNGDSKAKCDYKLMLNESNEANKSMS